jgi:type IV secretion system protein TrbF
VQVDKLGQAQTVAPATADYRPTDHEVAWRLAASSLRSAASGRSCGAAPGLDRRLQLRHRQRRARLNDYARGNDPFSKAGKTQISVDVASVIRASDDSFRVEWVERRAGLSRQRKFKMGRSFPGSEGVSNAYVTVLVIM